MLTATYFLRACFPNRKYENAAGAKCFSNLLAVGFQRIFLDLYWDVTRNLWSLCPVQLSASVTSSTSSNSSTPTSTASSGSTASAATAANLAQLLKRQDSSSLPVTSGSALTTTTPGSSSESGTPDASAADARDLVTIGPYSCTTSMDFQFLANVMSEHLDSTQYRQNATLKYFILNLHAAAPASNPTNAAETPSEAELPTRSRQLSKILSDELSAYLYTPESLRDERHDLNSSSSWFDVDNDLEPESDYFEVVENRGRSTTPNGWPSLSYIEMRNGKRVLVGYGHVDPQMEGYNFDGDSDVIFPRGYIETNISISTNSGGDVTNGCFFQSGQFSISGDRNNSWAISSATADTAADLRNEADSLTYCGVSPILNETLKGAPANQNFKPYETYVQNAIWSWAQGEPQNSSSTNDGKSRIQNRCAVLNSKSGKWQTENCDESHYSACRKPDEIYRWAISNAPASYARADLPCPDGTQFTVPHTALENTYLLNTWQNVKSSDDDIDDDLLWLNFNDLDAKACWVIGQNETCPYLPSNKGEREVVVPVVAGIIVFVLAGLTIFVKCAANRQQSKRRRRRGDDWGDYEGVPS